MSAKLPVKIENGMLHFDMDGEHKCSRCGRKGEGKFVTKQILDDPESAYDLCLQCAKVKVKR